MIQEPTKTSAMRRLLPAFTILTCLCMPVAAHADTTSIVNLNGATPTPVVDPGTPTPAPVQSATPVAMPVTGAPSSLPLVLLTLIAAAGYAAYRFRQRS